MEHRDGSHGFDGRFLVTVARGTIVGFEDGFIGVVQKGGQFHILISLGFEGEVWSVLLICDGA